MGEWREGESGGKVLWVILLAEFSLSFPPMSSQEKMCKDSCVQRSGHEWITEMIARQCA